MNQDELIQLAAAGAQALAELGAGESDELHEDPEAATTTGLDEALWLLSAAQRTGDDAGGYPRSNKRGRARTGDYPDLDRKRQRVSTDEEDEDEEERRGECARDGTLLAVLCGCCFTQTSVRSLPATAAFAFGKRGIAAGRWPACSCAFCLFLVVFV
jgi:hypothetical protein